MSFWYVIYDFSVCVQMYGNERTCDVYLSHVRLLPYICVTSLSNCDIWLQINPNLDINLTLDAGSLNTVIYLEFEGPVNFVVKISEV